MTRILFLAANPKGAPLARLDEEIRTIEEHILLSSMRDLFDVKQQLALRSGDLRRALLQYRPEIVHFAGLGTASGEIILEDEFGKSLPVSASAVGALFSILRDNVRCVVINACYAEAQARAIAEHVDCVIGMSRRAGDCAAICFAAAFYQALGFGRTVKTAFDLAVNGLQLEKLDADGSPVLLSKAPDFAVTDPRRADLETSSVLSRLGDGGAEKRSGAARQLGYLKDAAAVPILAARWPLEPDPTVRYWLAIALGWIGGDAAADVLARLRQEEEDRFALKGIDEALK
jgi:HEAT repeats